MKKKHVKGSIVLVAATLIMGLFSGFLFNPFEKGLSFFTKVNEESRVSHAKELLGKTYKGSNAQKLESVTALNELIVEKLHTNLPKDYKAKAREIAATVISESAKYDLDPIFVLAMIKTESGFNPLAIGPFAEIGLMQVKPDTAEWIAGKYGLPWNGNETLRDPSSNIRIGLAYVNYLRDTFDKKATRYVSAYNMGPKNVRRLIAKNIKPKEYKSRVMKNYRNLYKVLASKPLEANLIAVNY